MEVTAVLIDTVSIQKYIFSGNRLKENLGASYLVEQIFEGPLKIAVNSVLGKESLSSWEHWKTNPDQLLIEKDSECLFEIGFIGGGNGLLLFRKKEDAFKVVKEWTRSLLIYAPGLQTAVAVCPFKTEDFQSSLSRSFNELLKNKNSYFPVTTLPKFGVTLDCPLSNLSQEVDYRDATGEKRRISSASSARLSASNDSVKKMTDTYLENSSKWALTSEVDDLGQLEGQNFIAVVHIDGNNMGARFKSCGTLSEYRKLSNTIAEITRKAFASIVTAVSSVDAEDYSDEGIEIRKTEDAKMVLPLRPVIIGGDDITFITHAKLALPLSKLFIKRWTALGTEYEETIPDPLSACAGIAFVKTKYPFFQAYEFAEAMCASAKKIARQYRDAEASWVDFFIQQSGTTGDAETIRKIQYTYGNRRGFFGPYGLSDIKTDPGSMLRLSLFEKGIGDFKKKWPKNKLMELRSALILGEDATKHFLEKQAHKNLALPNPDKAFEEFKKAGWHETKTPYLDMIDFYDFYTDLDLEGGESL